MQSNKKINEKAFFGTFSIRNIIILLPENGNYSSKNKNPWKLFILFDMVWRVFYLDFYLWMNRFYFFKMCFFLPIVMFINTEPIWPNDIVLNQWSSISPIKPRDFNFTNWIFEVKFREIASGFFKLVFYINKNKTKNS